MREFVHPTLASSLGGVTRRRFEAAWPARRGCAVPDGCSMLLELQPIRLAELSAAQMMPGSPDRLQHCGAIRDQFARPGRACDGGGALLRRVRFASMDCRGRGWCFKIAGC